MSGFKGTIGKWFLRENKSTIMSEDKCLIARVFDGKGTALLADKNQSDIITEANALLISKAPEMLEMLKECKLQLEYLNEKFTETGTTNSLLSKIESLIKQSTEI